MHPRIGHGYDIHRLQPGGVLTLAGVVVATNLSPIAHSDGDVVIHAIVDALLGALGLGDIGQHYSDKDPRWRGAASSTFLEETVARMRAAGYRVGNLDITIAAEQPHLLPFKKPMIETLLSMLSDKGAAQPPMINVKAGTNEGCDAVGRGEAIAATAVVLLIPIS